MARVGPGRPIVRYVGCEIVTVKKFHFRPAPARARGPNAPFVFFTLKMSKIQHKTWVVAREARARPVDLGRAVDKFLNFHAHPGTARHSWAWSLPGPPFTQARGPSP